MVCSFIAAKEIILETFKTANIPDLNRNKARSIPLRMSSYAKYKIILVITFVRLQSLKY